MIIFDDFLPSSNLKKNLTSSSLWDNLKPGAPIQWVDHDKNLSNAFEHLCHLVWNEVVGIKQNINGWEYWTRLVTPLNADGPAGPVGFHTDNDLDGIVDSEEEQRLVDSGEIKTADSGFIYYAHTEPCVGGYLEIKRGNGELERIQPVPNRLIVFTPNAQHRVTEVVKGYRRSIISNLWKQKPSKYV